MPSDANGVYSLPDGYEAVTGETILASQHNPPLEDLAESMTQRIMATGAKPFTGPAKLADGSVGTPSLTMASATTSGWYKTTDGWGFSIGGAMVAEITSGGIRTGARYLGELIPFAGLTAPALTVLPYGQTLSRTTYAALWAFAQTEISAGNGFYNNGNGTTTFGIGDMRGRVPAGMDGIGGVLAARLNISGGMNGTGLGSVGGLQSDAILQAHLPNVNFTVTGTVNSTSTTSDFFRSPNGVSPFGAGAGSSSTAAGVNGLVAAVSSTGSISGGIAASGGLGTSFKLLQPTMAVNYLLFAGA